MIIGVLRWGWVEVILRVSLWRSFSTTSCDISAPGGPPQCCHMPAILRQRRVCQSGTDVACAIPGSVQIS